ncbi:hypothetical protein E4U52_006863 [Claviceps spartinae]|nr:hypothetical protein E4U52_006863 [Claviceps spartinae]
MAGDFRNRACAVVSMQSGFTNLSVAISNIELRIHPITLGRHASDTGHVRCAKYRRTRATSMPDIGGKKLTLDARFLQDHHDRQLERVSASRNGCATSAVLTRTISDSQISNEYAVDHGNNDDND